MKFLVTLTALTLSVSAFATEFKAQIMDIDCTITSEGKVTRTQTFGKEAKASFTEVKMISFKNLEALLPKVMEVSSQLPAQNEDGFAYTMIHEGKTYTLDTRDSKESMFLVRMITKSCR